MDGTGRLQTVTAEANEPYYELIRRFFARTGVPIIVQPVDADTAAYGEPAGGTCRSAFLRDPDGNVVQLAQRA